MYALAQSRRISAILWDVYVLSTDRADVRRSVAVRADTTEDKNEEVTTTLPSSPNIEVESTASPCKDAAPVGASMPREGSNQKMAK